MIINENYLKLQGSYLFSEIARRVSAYTAEHPEADVIRLGIGDVTRPLAPVIVKAMKDAADEMASADTFRGYGPEQGYDFLRRAIAENDYAGLGISADEIYVSDGAKCDCGNFQELFSTEAVIAVTDPVYTVYVDSNVMAGRTDCYNSAAQCFGRMVYLPATAENGFAPPLPEQKVDAVYICSPGNPTGMALNRDQLKVWVDWANANDVLILFDAAYERFVTDPDVPRSIFEIEGAKTCAVEFRSFSKTAGFTGTRCAFVTIPKTVTGADITGKRHPMGPLWLRRQTTKFNGVSYIVQRGAEAVYSPEGAAQVAENIAYYQKNAKVIYDGLKALGLEVYGGVNSPYVWLRTPGDMPSWDFFDKLLTEANVVGTPGAGFGAHGEGYFRLTAFGSAENTLRAVERLARLKF